MARFSRALVALAALASAACGVTEPKEVRVLGRIDRAAPEPRVTVPDTVQAGAPFTVRVLTTIGGCERGGDTEVSFQGATATVTPWDLELIQRPGTICDPGLSTAVHEASVTFPSAGSAVVVVHARDLGTDAEIDLESPVVVR